MEGQNGMSNVLKKVKPYVAMVSLQFGYSGMYIITMVSFKHGFSHWILSVYRHVIAFLVIAPFAFILERSLYFSSQTDRSSDLICIYMVPCSKN